MTHPRWNDDGADWPNRASSRFVAAGGIDWHLQIAGSGPALLLLHGTGAATHSWRGLLPILAREYTVIAPDLPGHGFSSLPRTGRLGLSDMATAIGALVAETRLSPEVIVGHSAGAAIGVALAERWADLRALVSINGALRPFRGMAGLLFPPMARLLFANPVTPHLFAMRAMIPGEVGRFMERSTGSALDRRGVDLYQRLFRSATHCEAALSMMAHWNLDALEARLRRLAVPLTLIYGTRDRAVPPSVAREVAAIAPAATPCELTGLGHLAHEEAPERVAEAIFQNVHERAMHERTA